MAIKSNKPIPKRLRGTHSGDAARLEIHFLFRFRDSIAPSIAEHQKVIRRYGFCWWGWWKRQSEDSRSDIWDALREEIAGRKQARIGLFDSDTGKVHCAIVVDVIDPAEAERDWNRGVPKAQAKYVPSYYRENPPSRAWLKITHIEEVEVDFFGKHSFTEPPKLRNYEGRTLDEFKNKKIVNPRELTGMETTIWRIRPARETDSSEEIVLTPKGLSKAITTEVVPCKSNTILHLTDLHFALGKHRKIHIWPLEGEAASHTMAQAIKSALGKQEIGLIIISGDFTFIGSSEEFDEARKGIAHLLQLLGLTPDNLIIVPGNHDIQWTIDEDYEPGAEVRRAPKEAMINYKRFYHATMRHEPDDGLSMGRRCLLPCGLTVEVCAINSSSLELGKNFLAGMGCVDEGGLSDVANELNWGDGPSIALRLLVIHHHLAVTEDKEPAAKYEQGYGLAVDAVRVQRLAASKGVHVALHGHKHRCFIWRSTVYELPERAQHKHRLGELSIVGGGSAGSSETEAGFNYFNLLTIDAGTLWLKMYRSEKGGNFGSFQTWKADLTLSPESNGLKLGDWIFTRET